METRCRRIQLLFMLTVIAFTGVGSGRPRNLVNEDDDDLAEQTLLNNYHSYSTNIQQDDIALQPYTESDEPVVDAMILEPSQYEEYPDYTLEKITDWDKDKLIQDENFEDYWQRGSKKVEKLLKEDGDRWPTFEEIEKLAGISEWKRERWKQLIKKVENRTEKPKRKVKFIYRRIQTSGKRNAIIAVSAVSTDNASKV